MPHIKGTSLIKIIKVLRKNREAANELLPDAFHHYLEERLLANAWYPEEDYLVLLDALGRMIGPSIEGDVWEFIGIQGAKEDFTTVYVAFVREGDPEGTFARAGHIWSLYRDTGRLVCTRFAPGRLQLELFDYPLAGAKICGTITGYYRELARLSGASNVRVRLVALPPPSDGPCRWSIQFDVGG